jgi:hypothetical protein
MSTAANASVGAEEILTSFFGPTGIQDKKSVYTGEMLTVYAGQRTLGETLPPGTTFTYRQLQSNATSEIYAVAVKAKGETRDWYAYFRHDRGRWKLNAIRTLALPGLFFEVLHDLAVKKRDREEESIYQNMQLTLQSDAQLKQFLLAHLKDMEALVRLSRAGKSVQAKQAVEALHLNTVAPLGSDERITDISIGGILDNSVGFLYVPVGVAPPAITPSDYIYVESVTGHWFLYKTT